MPKKGHTNNPNGRPKGKPNKVTKNLREFIADLIDGQRAQIVQDLQALEPKERLQILEKLTQYVIPKRQAQQIDLASLNDAQLDDVITNLTDTILDDGTN